MIVTTRTGRWPAAVVTLLAGTLLATGARAAEVRVISAGAVRAIVTEMARAYEKETGNAVTLTFGTVGSLILWRHPAHRVGWLFCWTGLIITLGEVGDEYAAWALFVRPGQLPGGLLVVWIINWLWVLAALPQLGLVTLLFPSGELPSPRWRPVAWFVVLDTILLALCFAFAPGDFGSSYTTLVNPFGLRGSDSWLPGLRSASLLAATVPLGLGAAHLLRRLRAAGGVERQQIKWFVYSAGVATLVAPLANVVPTPAGVSPALLPSLFALAMLGLPAAVGLAILRYRLYDIDLIVNRTLVYGALTATLGLVYFGSVVLLQGLLGAVTGEGRSELVTVLSTLTIAALFSPLRRRLQAFIDRRFYRRKYDAARTLSAFGASVRDNVELDTLSDKLLAVVDDTMRPEHASLWLRPPPRSGRR